jgi:hypothetical protein
MSGEFRIELRQTGRGERSSAHTFQLSVRIQPQPDSNVVSIHRAVESA